MCIYINLFIIEFYILEKHALYHFVINKYKHYFTTILWDYASRSASWYSIFTLSLYFEELNSYVIKPSFVGVTNRNSKLTDQEHKHQLSGNNNFSLHR